MSERSRLHNVVRDREAVHLLEADVSTSPSLPRSQLSTSQKINVALNRTLLVLPGSFTTRTFENGHQNLNFQLQFLIRNNTACGDYTLNWI